MCSVNPQSHHITLHIFRPRVRYRRAWPLCFLSLFVFLKHSSDICGWSTSLVLFFKLYPPQKNKCQFVLLFVSLFLDVGGSAPAVDECGGHFGPVDSGEVMANIIFLEKRYFFPGEEYLRKKRKISWGILSCQVRNPFTEKIPLNPLLKRRKSV